VTGTIAITNTITTFVSIVGGVGCCVEAVFTPFFTVLVRSLLFYMPGFIAGEAGATTLLRTGMQ
jgi:hypothetical protein